MQCLRIVRAGKKGLGLTTRLPIFLFAAYLTSSSHLQAGSWTQDAGHGQIILTSEFFQTSTFFNAYGTTQSFANEGHFRQSTLSSYLEYGLTSRYTLVLNVPAPFLSLSQLILTPSLTSISTSTNSPSLRG